MQDVNDVESSRVNSSNKTIREIQLHELTGVRPSGYLQNGFG